MVVVVVRREGGRGGRVGRRRGEERTGRDGTGVDVRQDREKFRKTFLLGSCIQVHAKRPPKIVYVFFFYIYIHIKINRYIQRKQPFPR